MVTKIAEDVMAVIRALGLDPTRVSPDKLVTFGARYVQEHPTLKELSGAEVASAFLELTGFDAGGQPIALIESSPSASVAEEGAKDQVPDQKTKRGPCNAAPKGPQVPTDGGGAQPGETTKRHRGRGGSGADGSYQKVVEYARSHGSITTSKARELVGGPSTKASSAIHYTKQALVKQGYLHAYDRKTGTHTFTSPVGTGGDGSSEAGPRQDPTAART